MINQQLSDKIKAISFLCTCMVVYRHAYTHEAFFGLTDTTSHPLYDFIVYGFTNITSIAVPYFFLISGYFFFKESYYKKGCYSLMIRKKFNTLFIPFCIWNAFAILPMMVGGKVVTEEHWYNYVLNFLHSDYNGPLWYVRTLMLLMILSPFYDWLFILGTWLGKKNEQLIQIFVLICIMYNWYPMDSSTLSTEGWLFFLLGGILRKHEQWQVFKLSDILTYVLFGCWIIGCFLLQSTNIWLGKMFLLFGIFIFWQFISYCFLKRKFDISKYSFFIYVTHFILLKISKTLLAKMFFGVEFMAVVTFIILPIIVVLLMVKVGKLWNRLSPKTFAIVTGGRN